MILSRPPVSLPLVSAGSLPEALEDVAQAGLVAREYFGRVQAEVRARHEAGAGGLELVAVYTDAVDRLVRFLFASASAHFMSRFARLNPQCAVVAQGGYGRGELNPGSDIDLLFLYPWKVNPYVETVAEVILYALWDAGLQVGNALRNIRECERLSGRDLKVKTALLDARYLAGDEALYAEFDRRMLEEVWGQNPTPFFKEKLAENADRHARSGDSVYLLQPQLKDGQGGLRDLHTALWMAKVRFKVRSFRELVTLGVIAEAAVGELETALDFLWRVRNALHLAADGHQDQLTFELQERIAPTLGFAEAQRHGVTLSAATRELIRDCLPLLAAERATPAVATAFLGILRAKGHVYETLFEMHKLGVLREVVPEFGHIDCLIARDPFHIYTVDHHSLMGVREVERLRAGEFARTLPHLTQVMNELPGPVLLFLGMMFHDVGKGHGHDHAGRGARMMREIAARLGLNEDESAACEFLVRHHLLMSHLAQRRDVDDDQLVVDFCRTVGSIDTLQRLYVLTYADMRAVGPGVRNNWRDPPHPLPRARLQRVRGLHARSPGPLRHALRRTRRARDEHPGRAHHHQPRRRGARRLPHLARRGRRRARCGALGARRAEPPARAGRRGERRGAGRALGAPLDPRAAPAPGRDQSRGPQRGVARVHGARRLRRRSGRAPLHYHQHALPPLARDPPGQDHHHGRAGARRVLRDRPRGAEDRRSGTPRDHPPRARAGARERGAAGGGAGG